MSFLASDSITRQNSLFFAVLADYNLNDSNHILTNIEVRHCEVGRSGSLIIFIPKGKVHYVDTSAKRIHPNGIGPLRGFVPKGIFSQQKSLAFLQGFAPQPGLEPGTP